MAEWGPAKSTCSKRMNSIHPDRRDRRAFLLRVICAICLLAGMSTHAATILRHGLFWNYGGGVPLFTRVYWASLTFLDPLASLLLFALPRIGAVAMLAIISTDVAHKLWFFEHYRIQVNWMVGAQCAFLVFVVASFRLIWGGSEHCQLRSLRRF